mgnify:CR=1 FL=1
MFVRLLFLVLLALINVHGNANATAIEEVTSPSGIKAWLVRDHSIPLTAVRFIFRGSGAISDPKGKAGRASMASALIDEGAGALQSQIFQKQLQDRSIVLSFIADKDFFGGTLKVLNKYRAKGVELASLALTTPRFDLTAVNRIRAQIVTSLKAQAARPGYKARREWSRVIYNKHPYARPVVGTQKSVTNIRNRDLHSFVNDNLTKDRLLVSIVGDISVEEVKSLLDNMFESLPKVGKQTKVGAAQIPAKGALHVFSKAVPQSVVLFGHRGVTRKDPNFYTAYVINHILGGGSFTSRLYNSVREERGLAYSVSTHLSVRRNAPLIIGQLSTSNEKVAESIRLVRSEWRKMAINGVGEETLKNAKSFINGSFALQFSSSDRIANLLTILQYYNLSPSYLRKRREYINLVSRNDIQKFARKFLNADALTFIVVGQPTDLKDTNAPSRREFQTK